MTQTSFKFPNTYIIGVQKAGTTSLHYWLSQHPQIFAPIHLKDADYFADPEEAKNVRSNLQRDLRDYDEEKIILHSYVNYILFEDALKRINHYSPKAKIIVLLRDPVERALSAYRYNKKINKEKRSLEEALIYTPKDKLTYSKDACNFTYLEHGMYGRQLKRVFKFFGRNQVLILDFLELKKDPKNLIRKVFAFLDVDDTYQPVLQKKNVTGSTRNGIWHRMLTKPSIVRSWIVKLFLSWWLPRKKRNAIVKYLIDLNTKDTETTDPPIQLKNKLAKYFEEDQEVLRVILDSENS